MATDDTPYILAVDDELGFRTLYSRLLEPAGFRVRTASDANDALRIFAEEVPAVAILDIHMPGQDGLWLADQIRAKGRNTAMILATSDAAVPPIASLKPGIVAYLVKPYDARTLREAVEQALAWRSSAGGPAQKAPGPTSGAPHAAPPLRASGYVPPEADLSPLRPGSDYAGGRVVANGSMTERKLLWALVLLLAGALAAAVAWYVMVGRDGDALSRVSAASGVVRTLGRSNKVVTQGSGFFVAPDVFVTAHHVVKDGVGARIEGPNHVVYRVDGIAGMNRAHDLVLLRTSPSSPSYLRISESPPAVGDAIAVYGAPLGLTGTLSTGIISAQSSSSRLQISAPISPGSSGSPVVDESGAVVGVAVSSRTAGQALNFAVPAPFISRLLAAASGSRPFTVVARGAGDDRERHDLAGPVRLVTMTSDVTDAAAVDALVMQGGVSDTLRLSFDQLGKLIEREDGAAGTVSYFVHDEQGRLQTETVRRGDVTVRVWDFLEVGGRRRRAVDLSTGTVRFLEYEEEGRVLSEEIRHGVETLTERRWTYDVPSWPSVPASAVSSGEVQLDSHGNVTVHRVSSGVEFRYQYTFDEHGNWVVREAERHANGQGQHVRSDRRSIEYWE